MFRWFGIFLFMSSLVIGSQAADEISDKKKMPRKEVSRSKEKEPGSGEKEPGSGEKEPGSGEKEPGSGEKEPGSGEKEPGSGEKEPEEKGEKTEENPPEENDVSVIKKYLKPMVYNRETRDPFERPAAPLKMGQIYGPFLELQSYNLDRFVLKGLIWRTRNPRAIFRSPDNKEYRLTIKDYIGENFGYIAAIREREVVIIQTVEENNKKYSATKVVFLKN